MFVFVLSGSVYYSFWVPYSKLAIFALFPKRQNIAYVIKIGRVLYCNSFIILDNQVSRAVEKSSDRVENSESQMSSSLQMLIRRILNEANGLAG